MMRTLSLLSLALLLALSVSAQSRRTPEATPTPVAIQDDPATYSESIPQKKRPVVARPLINSDALPKTPNTAASSNKTNRPVKMPATKDGDEVVKVETNLITIPVSVFDRNGLYVRNLRKEDFKIFEDGKEQQIEYFGTPEKPFTVILMLDTSPSTEYEIDEIRDAAKAFVNQLKSQDKVMVMSFDRKIRVLTEATGDRPAIYAAIEKADFGSGTALYDAVSFSISKRMSAVTGRKAIVLFTDGVDTQSSKSNYDTTLALAEEADSLIFPIYYNTYESTHADAGDATDPAGLPPPGSTAQEYAVGKAYLEELASYTGGRVFRPESTPGGLTAAFEGIAEELRRQYSIGYIPNDDGKPGQRKQIKVRVNRPNLVLRARDSYIVGAK